MCLLYETGIIAARLFGKKRPGEDSAEIADPEIEREPDGTP
jgi:Sec-independent protein secretion pathway component TatC